MQPIVAALFLYPLYVLKYEAEGSWSSLSFFPFAPVFALFDFSNESPTGLSRVEKMLGFLVWAIAVPAVAILLAMNLRASA